MASRGFHFLERIVNDDGGASRVSERAFLWLRKLFERELVFVIYLLCQLVYTYRALFPIVSPCNRCNKDERSIRHRDETILLADGVRPGPRHHPVVCLCRGKWVKSVAFAGCFSSCYWANGIDWLFMVITHFVVGRVVAVVVVCGRTERGENIYTEHLLTIMSFFFRLGSCHWPL